MNDFTTSIAKRTALWSAYLKTLSHRVKHTVKLQKHRSPLLMKLLMKLFSKNSSTGEAELCQTGPKYSVCNGIIIVDVEAKAVGRIKRSRRG
jgi:hypothetical protein